MSTQEILPVMFFSFLVCMAAFIFLSCIWKLIKLVSMRKLEEQVEELESQQAERKEALMESSEMDLDNRSKAIFQVCSLFLLLNLKPDDNL